MRALLGALTKPESEDEAESRVENRDIPIPAVRITILAYTVKDTHAFNQSYIALLRQMKYSPPNQQFVRFLSSNRQHSSQVSSLAVI